MSAGSYKALGGWFTVEGRAGGVTEGRKAGGTARRMEGGGRRREGVGTGLPLNYATYAKCKLSCRVIRERHASRVACLGVYERLRHFAAASVPASSGHDPPRSRCRTSADSASPDPANPRQFPRSAMPGTPSLNRLTASPSPPYPKPVSGLTRSEGILRSTYSSPFLISRIFLYKCIRMPMLPSEFDDEYFWRTSILDVDPPNSKLKLRCRQNFRYFLLDAELDDAAVSP